MQRTKAAAGLLARCAALLEPQELRVALLARPTLSQLGALAQPRPGAQRVPFSTHASSGLVSGSQSKLGKRTHHA